MEAGARIREEGILLKQETQGSICPSTQVMQRICPLVRPNLALCYISERDNMNFIVLGALFEQRLPKAYPIIKLSFCSIRQVVSLPEHFSSVPWQM